MDKNDKGYEDLENDEVDEETDSEEVALKEDESDEMPEDLNEDSIENLVTPTSDSQRFVSQPTFTPRQISPVLESRAIPKQSETFQEIQTTQTTETARRESSSYNNSKYYVNTSQNQESDYPEIINPTNPTLEQNFSRVQQTFRPRLNPTDTNLVTQNTERDWEKKYQAKFADSKRDRRRF